MPMNELNVKMVNILTFDIGKSIGIENFLNERMKSCYKAGDKIEEQIIIK